MQVILDMGGRRIIEKGRRLCKPASFIHFTIRCTIYFPLFLLFSIVERHDIPTFRDS